MQAYESREESAALGRLVGTMLPQSPQEIARGRHADLLREATQERLAASLRGDDEPQVRVGALRRALTAVYRVGTRRPVVRTA